MGWQEYVEFMHGEDTFHVLSPQSNPKGPSYQPIWTRTGRTLAAGYRKLDTRERYEAGLESSTYAYRIFADSPVGDLEKLRVESTATGQLNVRSSVDEESEGLSLIVAERTA